MGKTASCSNVNVNNVFNLYIKKFRKSFSVQQVTEPFLHNDVALGEYQIEIHKLKDCQHTIHNAYFLEV